MANTQDTDDSIKTNDSEAADSSEGSGNNLSERLAMVSIVLCMVSQAAALVFFLNEGVKIGGIDFEGDELVFGWYLQFLAISFGVAGMILGLKSK